MLALFALLTLGAAFFAVAGLVYWAPLLWAGALCLLGLVLLVGAWALGLAPGRVSTAIHVQSD